MRLVIAEKPSVAMSIAKVLGATARKEGHMEGGGWLVSWCPPCGGLHQAHEAAVDQQHGGRRHPGGLRNLCSGHDYDGLHQAALCRMKADWLVGINATRLFSVLYGRTLNIGRVMSPTLALIAQREAEIAAFEPVPFYTVELTCGSMTAAGERIAAKEDAAAITAVCEDGIVSVQTVERREKSERPPALYDLTTLQRDANRALGYTAQHTHDSFSQKDSATSQLTGKVYFMDLIGDLPFFHVALG